jgi:hypothetical protein
MSSASRLVDFIAPESWQGRFDIQHTSATGDWGSFVGTWLGNVTYERVSWDAANIFGHYADYAMTSAAGSFKAQGTAGGNLYSYRGIPVDDSGTLRWYYAKARGEAGSIPMGSYEAFASHGVIGDVVITGEEPGVVFGVTNAVEAVMWSPESGDATTPRLDVIDGAMRATRVRPLTVPGLTETLQWDLAPSSAVEDGFYTWGDKTAKKGVYWDAPRSRCQRQC